MRNTVLVEEALFVSAIALAQSEAARKMWTAGVKKEDRVVAARAYVELARELGVPSFLWALKERNIEGYYSGAALTLLAAGERLLGPAREIVEAGASVATRELFGNPDWGNFELRVTYQDLGDMMPFILLNKMEGERARLAFQSVLSGGADAFKGGYSGYLSGVAAQYRDAVRGSSKTSKGMLSKADERAKKMAELMLSCEKELLLASSSPLVTRAVKGAVREALADAKARVAAKSQAAPNGVSPEEIENGASEEQKRRVLALGDMIRRCPDDKGFINAMFESCAWLKEAPLLSCVRLSGSECLMGIALGAGSDEATRLLDAMGANMWLAAAQEESGNACDWAILKTLRKKGQRGGGDLSMIAAGLMKGAWLNGASDPKERCLELCRELVASGQKPGLPGYGEALRALGAALERQALDDALGIQAKEGASPSASPVRKRARI